MKEEKQIHFRQGKGSNRISFSQRSSKQNGNCDRREEAKRMLVLKDSLSTLEAGDEHIDVAGADVLTVEFVTSLLDIVLRGKENKASASLSSEALLQVDVVLFDLNVTEELDHLGLGDVTRHAAELDAL